MGLDKLVEYSARILKDKSQMPIENYELILIVLHFYVFRGYVFGVPSPLHTQLSRAKI